MYLILLLFGLFTHCVVISALYVYSSDESGNRNPSPLKTHKNWLVLPTFGPSVSVLQIMGWPSLKTGFRFNRFKQYCNTRSVTIVHIDRYIHSRFILSCFRILCWPQKTVISYDQEAARLQQGTATSWTPATLSPTPGSTTSSRESSLDPTIHTASTSVLSTRSPRQLIIQRSEEGFGFTLRHFIVYPPEVRIEFCLLFFFGENRNLKNLKVAKK